MSEDLLVTMYSVKKFPENLRESFILNDSPYESNISISYLEELGVFHYREQGQVEAVAIPVNGMDIFEEVGFDAYKYSGFLNSVDYSIAEWDEAYSLGEKRRRARYIEKHDPFAWIIWEEHCVIKEVLESHISIA